MHGASATPGLNGIGSSSDATLQIVENLTAMHSWKAGGWSPSHDCRGQNLHMVIFIKNVKLEFPVSAPRTMCK